MAAFKRKDPETLAGADPATDCQGQPVDTALTKTAADDFLPLQDSIQDSNAELDGGEDEDEIPSHVTWLNVRTPKPDKNATPLNTWQPLRGRWSIFLERLALFVERPINKLTSTQFNPIYHTGTIAFFLLAIVGLTGLYLFFFFQYGFDASYRAVAVMESQFIARTIRAGHRYASGALVIVTLLHAYRTLFLEKFRGPRWLAWVTGVVLTIVIWIAGVTGYWLIWDDRALLITDTFRRALERLTNLTPNFMVYLLGAGETGRSWIFFLVLIAAHILLFLIALAFFYLHIRRLKRPKWLPPVHWVIGIGLVLLLGSLIFPAGMLTQADFGRLPGSITFDPIFLFFLPFPGATWLWVGLIGVSLLLAALPWISRGKKRKPSPANEITDVTQRPDKSTYRANGTFLPPPVRIIKERCTGCTKCALDCPYGAIEMVERHDGRPHKYIALEHTDRCVSCGICVGSCDALAVTLGDVMPETLWGLVSSAMVDQPSVNRMQFDTPSRPFATTDQIDERVRGSEVVYTCERHALHGARSFLEGQLASAGGNGLVVIPLPCVGAVPPDLLSRTMDAGAISVRVVGCPPDDCAGREGNLWASQRLARQRVPRLRRPYEDSPIIAAWLSPDAFTDVFRQEIPLNESGHPDFQKTRRLLTDFNWRGFIPALLILGAILFIQILLTDIPLISSDAGRSMVQITTTDLGAAFGTLTTEQAADKSYQFTLLINGQEAYSQEFGSEELLGRSIEDRLPFFYELPLEPGDYEFSLHLTGDTGSERLLFEGPVHLQSGEVWRPPLESFTVPSCSPGKLFSCPQ